QLSFLYFYFQEAAGHETGHNRNKRKRHEPVHRHAEKPMARRGIGERKRRDTERGIKARTTWIKQRVETVTVYRGSRSQRIFASYNLLHELAFAAHPNRGRLDSGALRFNTPDYLRRIFNAHRRRHRKPLARFEAHRVKERSAVEMNGKERLLS